MLAFGRPLLALTVGHGGVTPENITRSGGCCRLGNRFVANTSGQPVFAASARKANAHACALALIINTVAFLPEHCLLGRRARRHGVDDERIAALSLLNILLFGEVYPAFDGSHTPDAQRTRLNEDAESDRCAASRRCTVKTRATSSKAF